MSRESLFASSDAIAEENADRAKKTKLPPGRRKVRPTTDSRGVEDLVLGNALKDAEILAQHGPVKQIMKDGQLVQEEPKVSKIPEGLKCETKFTEEQLSCIARHYPAAAAHLRKMQAPAKPRRWIVEKNHEFAKEFAGLWDYCESGVMVATQGIRIVGEAKPITHEQLMAAQSKTMNQYTAGPYNITWLRLVLRELGIEVEES